MMENKNEQQTAPEGFAPVAAQYFTGTAWLKMLVTPDEKTNCAIGDVIFEPGARNNWHTHPSNQILIVTQGIGYYQEEGSRKLHAVAQWTPRLIYFGVLLGIAYYVVSFWTDYYGNLGKVLDNP